MERALPFAKRLVLELTEWQSLDSDHKEKNNYMWALQSVFADIVGTLDTGTCLCVCVSVCLCVCVSVCMCVCMSVSAFVSLTQPNHHSRRHLVYEEVQTRAYVITRSE